MAEARTPRPTRTRHVRGFVTDTSLERIVHTHTGTGGATPGVRDPSSSGSDTEPEDETKDNTSAWEATRVALRGHESTLSAEAREAVSRVPLAAEHVYRRAAL